MEIPFVLDMQLPRADIPNPIQPRTFYFREAIEYSVTNNYAILDIASNIVNVIAGLVGVVALISRSGGDPDTDSIP